MGRLFGTDGVRGTFGEDLTTDLAFALGRAGVTVLRRYEQGRFSLLVGRDTRASGEALEAAIVAGAREAGADVMLAGVEPTPAIAYLTTHLKAGAGVVISASHNPPEDNGIKFFGPFGYKLSDDLEDEIEAELGSDTRTNGAPTGRMLPLPDGERTYVEHLTSAALARLDGMKVVIDCANGAASHVAPEVLRALGADVYPIFHEPDGTNINVGCGALHPEVVAHAVKAAGADVGIAHDGDADRALFADAEGNVIDGDQVLAASAVAMKQAGTLAGNIVVTTVMANLGFRRAMQEAGIEMVATKVGDRYVLEEMLNRGAVLGGEQSGHIIFAEHATTGDGLLTAVLFLTLARAKGTTVAELARTMQKFPQVLVSVPVARKEELDAATELQEAVRTAQDELGGSGRVLVRASGTEQLVRVMVEAETEAAARHHADVLVEHIRAALA